MVGEISLLPLIDVLEAGVGAGAPSQTLWQFLLLATLPGGDIDMPKSAVACSLWRSEMACAIEEPFCLAERDAMRPEHKMEWATLYAHIFGEDHEFNVGHEHVNMELVLIVTVSEHVIMMTFDRNAARCVDVRQG